MTFTWCLAAGALVLAGAALLKARQMSKQLARLSDSLLQLRYEHGQLSSRVERVEVSRRQSPDTVLTSGPTTTAFVPLSSLKR